MTKLFLDLDGVLADFDFAASRHLGHHNIYQFEFIYGPKVFWDILNGNPNFFRELPKRWDADQLWAAVKHLNPTILTALPKVGADRVDEQKRAWVAEHFGTDVEVITCQTHDKPLYATPGAVLVDDRAVVRQAWVDRGGTYIIHKDAPLTVNVMKSIGILPPVLPRNEQPQTPSKKGPAAK